MASPTPELEPTAAAAGTGHNVTSVARSQRVLACVLCQQRKVKCDRKFPCANCVRVGVDCVPASLVPRQRRRRFAERELLERLRHYETLLRQNNINFRPLHPDSPTSDHSVDAGLAPSSIAHSRHSDGRSANSFHNANAEVASKDKTLGKPEAKPVDLWHAISRVTLDPDEEGDNSANDANSRRADGNVSVGDDESNARTLAEHRRGKTAASKNAWDHHRYQSDQGNDNDNEHLLFGPTKTSVRLSTLHPEQVHIFRLWQIYLQNVDPLLKVTHTPTLQSRILDAAGNVANISPTLEALIFSIYCMSILSLADHECLTLFGSPKKELLAGYQFACQQALLNCRALRGTGDSLTALYLYLVSVGPQTDPRSLSSMLAAAIRIAKRMGLHDDSTYATCTALEAEMRRRLWWSLVIYDHRICEMCNYKTTTLLPTWDCKTLLNVNDFEIRTEMKTPPVVHDKPTEVLFAVVRSELADFIRHSEFHLNFINPSLNAIARTKDGPAAEGDELMVLERTIEDKHLKFCDQDNPLHFMTIWTTRGYLARHRLLDYYSRTSTSATHQTDAQRNAALMYALSMLECDTKLRTSPLTERYLWLVDSYVPALAYIHILNGLRKRPMQEHAEQAWDAMSANYEARAMDTKPVVDTITLVFSQVVLQAWDAREALYRQEGRPLEPPRIVSTCREKLRGQNNATFPQQRNSGQHADVTIVTGPEASSLPMPMDFSGVAPTGQYFAGLGPGGFPNVPGQPMMGVDTGQFWNTMDWKWMHTWDGRDI